MGILNTSPESFFKKSIQTEKNSIKNAVQKMECEGANFIDVGGMSTAPYLTTIISEKQESKRITDAIKIIQNISNLPISVDTCRSSVAKQALELGVEIINDISGLKYDKKILSVIGKFQPSLILCAYSPKTISGNLITQTKNLLQESIKLANSSKILNSKIVLDPAIGFFRKSGKGPFFTKIKSDWIIRDLETLQNLNSIKKKFPVLVSVSNKSFLGKILNEPEPSDRLAGSLAAEVLSVLRGADIIRTHNVRESKQAVSFAQKMLRTNKSL